MRAFFVCGPESSGTKNLTHILCAAGCVGDSRDEQEFDTSPPSGQTPIVWRRSVPHGALAKPDITGILKYLSQNGYRATALITTRDWFAMAMSQTSYGHTASLAHSYANIKNAYAWIFEEMARNDCDFVMVSYEALLLHQKGFLKELSRYLMIELPVTELFDANKKRYE